MYLRLLSNVSVRSSTRFSLWNKNGKQRRPPAPDTCTSPPVGSPLRLSGYPVQGPLHPVELWGLSVHDRQTTTQSTREPSSNPQKSRWTCDRVVAPRKCGCAEEGRDPVSNSTVAHLPWVPLYSLKSTKWTVSTGREDRLKCTTIFTGC